MSKVAEPTWGEIQNPDGKVLRSGLIDRYDVEEREIRSFGGPIATWGTMRIRFVDDPITYEVSAADVRLVLRTPVRQTPSQPKPENQQRWHEHCRCSVAPILGFDGAKDDDGSYVIAFQCACGRIHAEAVRPTSE